MKPCEIERTSFKNYGNLNLDVTTYVAAGSGDTDGRVPVTSTRYSINAMKLRARARSGWRAWFYRQQVAGWAVEYKEGLTLVTVRGAGHQVPLFAPDRSLAMLYHFLRGQPLPASTPR